MTFAEANTPFQEAWFLNSWVGPTARFDWQLYCMGGEL